MEIIVIILIIILFHTVIINNNRNRYFKVEKGKRGGRVRYIIYKRTFRFLIFDFWGDYKVFNYPDEEYLVKLELLELYADERNILL